MPPRFNEEDSKLIASLHALSKKSPKLVRSSVYNAPAEPSMVVRSWKMNEFKYYDIPSPFPTLARGLFTMELPQEKREREGGEENPAETRYRIVARGYDKFFNIGEVPWTTWAALQSHTAAPYTLTLKSNGCIIFFAALTRTKLLVTSKHSVGPVEGVKMSHAQAGEMWLRRYLEAKEKTEADLASQLWDNNLTAIAELCDDSFEEHVLGYPPEKTGLHLHGLNESSKHFRTLSQGEVDAFADQWGFIKTPSIVLNTINEVREFTQHCAETGEWNGEAVEGFVVRTHVTKPPEGRRGSRDASPYAPGSTFFFKVKFDEPYMMYRDWREVTKSLLSQHSSGQILNPNKLPKSKMKRKETKVYINWVIREIKQNPKAFEGYQKGKGIIATRERFLKWLESESGKEELSTTEGEGAPVPHIADDVGTETTVSKAIIVPVAIPGCGKTSVSVALAHLFGFGHTQSDDVKAKKPAPVFIQNVANLLETYDVVIADKNNHLRQHRDQLREIARKNYDPPVKLIALDWSSSVSSMPPAQAHNICCDRILGRGEKHQTLRADTQGKSHEDVIWQFIQSTQELGGDEVDTTIDMELTDDLEEAVKRAVDGLRGVLGLEKPGEDEIQEALKSIQNYEPKIRQEIKAKGKKETIRYFAFLPEFDLRTFVDDVFEQAKTQHAEGTVGGVDEDELSKKFANLKIRKADESFWELLKEKDRVAKRPHITL
ncbi:hypothetical protein AX16_005319, partial [Volvariella volvacea WC 439]